MKKIVYLFSGFVAGILLITLMGSAFVYDNVFLVEESKYGFNETIDRIEALGKERSWTVSHMYNLQATMERNQMEVNPVVVMSLCKPAIAYKVLSADRERPVSAIMPCRVSVYATEEGKIMVSRMKTGILTAMLSGVSRAAMEEAGNEIEEMLELVTLRN